MNVSSDRLPFDNILIHPCVQSADTSPLSKYMLKQTDKAVMITSNNIINNTVVVDKVSLIVKW